MDKMKFASSQKPLSLRGLWKELQPGNKVKCHFQAEVVSVHLDHIPPMLLVRTKAGLKQLFPDNDPITLQLSKGALPQLSKVDNQAPLSTFDNGAVGAEEETLKISVDELEPASVDSSVESKGSNQKEVENAQDEVR